MPPPQPWFRCAGVCAGDPSPTALEEFPVWSAPRRITSGPKEHLLASYFGIDCWSPNYRYVTKESTAINSSIGGYDNLTEAQSKRMFGVFDYVYGCETGWGSRSLMTTSSPTLPAENSQC